MNSFMKGQIFDSFHTLYTILSLGITVAILIFANKHLIKEKYTYLYNGPILIRSNWCNS